MFRESTPFRQFSLIFKLFGFQLTEISIKHKIVALLAFLCEIIYWILLIMANFQFKDHSEKFMELTFQTTFVVAICCKMIYYWCKFEKMESFKIKMCKLFNNCDGNFIEGFKTAKVFSLLCSVSYLTLATIATVFSFTTKTNIVLLWRPPIVMDENLLFNLHWFEQTIGIFYGVTIFMVMDLYPSCIIIMLQAYLKKLNHKYGHAINREEFIKCVEMYNEIRTLVLEFQEIFSPLLFVQAFSMYISFCVTLLIMASNVSFRIILNFEFKTNFFKSMFTTRSPCTD